MNARAFRYLALSLLAWSGWPAAGVAETITLPPSRDTTIFSESNEQQWRPSPGLYAGTNGNVFARRALLYFDVAGNLPSGATVTGAQLTLTLAQVAGSGMGGSGGGQPRWIRLFALSGTWAEGVQGAGASLMTTGSGSPAANGDTTWNDRVFASTNPTLWNTPGGDFMSTASSSLLVTSNPVGTTYTWASTAQLVADAQNWLDHPSSNFGWILKNDDEGVARTFYAFYSREGDGSSTSAPPLLTITYTPQSWRQTWLAQYYSPVTSYPGDLANPTGDGLNNLLDYAYGLSPLVAHPPGSGLHTGIAASGANNSYTTTFLRDPRAIDLTYELQSSDDLIHWITIVQSTAGAVPTGTDYVSEADAPGAAPVQLVTAQETLPNSTKTHFICLRVTRSP